MVHVEPVENACAVILDAGEPIGRMRLWLPEGIASNSGFSSVYPVGQPWHKTDKGWTQHIGRDGLFSGGNFVRVDEETLECVGIRVPVDQPVEWTTRIAPWGDNMRFHIRLTNLGDKTIEKAGAAVCLKFLDADWWSPDRVFVRSGGGIRSIDEFGMDAGRPNEFQAYLCGGQTYDNLFYREFWGFNAHRLDFLMMASEHPDGMCVTIHALSAYFMHSNRGNPCTDAMLAFGDLAPGQSAESWVAVYLSHGKATEALDLRGWAVLSSED